MWQPTRTQWWLLLAVALAIVLAWPPREGKSLALKLVNWAVDPSDRLPTLPGPLPMGLGDDPEAVLVHDLETQRYDQLYRRGGWTRLRLELKNADDPFDPATERGLLTALGVIVAFVAWRWEDGTREKKPGGRGRQA